MASEARHECRPDDWVEDYAGYRCRVCGDFVPFGCEPWAPDDYDVAEMVREAFAETREQAEKERVGERIEPGLMEFRCRDGGD